MSIIMITSCIVYKNSITTTFKEHAPRPPSLGLGESQPAGEK